MSANKEAAATTSKAAATKVNRVEFCPPTELAAEFGVNAMEDGHIQGVVSSHNVRVLIAAFGLDPQKQFGIPFHHIHKHRGEITSLRIEPAASHVVDGMPVMGHQWMYRQEMPERTA